MPPLWVRGVAQEGGESIETAEPGTLEAIIATLDMLVAYMQTNPVKTRMTAILITELQKAVAFAREVLRVEGNQHK